MSENESIWKGATVLLTGGTGWFGRAFTRYALERLGIRSLRILSRDEHKQHSMRQVWSDTAPDSRITYIVADVRDKDRLTRAMYGVDVCVTAAALKRVEGSSSHARELLKTNTIGTANVIDAALDCGVPRTIFLSSDKALMATNAYGKSKAMAEDLMIEGNSLAGGRNIRFASVRYGNILGSTGSVLHLWEAAYDRGEPLLMTLPTMTRFFMPVEQAVELVVSTADIMRGGEIFCPEMPRARLVDLAEAAFPGHPQRFMGERPGGEKTSEALIGEDEARHTYRRCGGLLYCIEPQEPSWDGHRKPIGTLVEPGFSLRSDMAPLATVDELRTMLAQVALA